MNPFTGEVATIDPRAKGEPIDEKKGVDIKQTPQFLAREEIARRRQADRTVEETSFNPDVMDDDGNITPAKVEAAPELKEDAPMAGEPPADGEPLSDDLPTDEPEQVEAKEEKPEELRELIVDGQRVKVPVSKILDAGVRTLQKETSADMKLAAASELERQLRAKLENHQPPQGAESIQQRPQADAQPSDEDAALAHAIQFGSEEEAAKAIAKVRALGRATPEQIQEFVRAETQKATRASIPDQLSFHDANAKIRSEHKAIFSDPDLEQYFMLQENKARQGGDRRPYAELYQDIAKTMTTKFNLAKPEVAPKSQPIHQERLTRKREAPRPVQGAGGAPGKSPAPTQQTVSDYVQKQRQRRGLQPLEKQGI